MSKEEIDTQSNGTSLQEWIEVVKRKAELVKFGSIVITIHEGQVTQIESIEKTRFSPRKREE